jgi:hypothetical protein
MRSGIEKMQSIPICDLFYHVTMDIVGPLPETTKLAISICLLLLTIILNVVKHCLLRNMMFALLLSF